MGTDLDDELYPKIALKLKEKTTMKELQSKVSFVTGGSRGIGRAIVHALANAGADVAFTYHLCQDQALEVVKSVEMQGVRCRAYRADVASSEEMEKVIKLAISELGPITILVNNAGITRDKSFV